MARKANQKIRVIAHIGEKGKDAVPWFEYDGEDKLTEYLPREQSEKYMDKMMENVGRNMSRYYAEHPIPEAIKG